MYFEKKHVEAGKNFLHELATFLKYHMPLRWFVKETGISVISLNLVSIIF